MFKAETEKVNQVYKVEETQPSMWSGWGEMQAEDDNSGWTQVVQQRQRQKNKSQ